GVRSGRRGALVLAELWRDLARGDDVRAREPPPQLLCDRLLVPRLAEREEQADRYGVGLDLRQGAQVELTQDPVRPDPLLDAEAALEGDERLRMLRAGSIEVRAGLAAEMEQVL